MKAINENFMSYDLIPVMPFSLIFNLMMLCTAPDAPQHVHIITPSSSNCHQVAWDPVNRPAVTYQVMLY